jgi:hypothetical protein
MLVIFITYQWREWALHSYYYVWLISEFLFVSIAQTILSNIISIMFRVVRYMSKFIHNTVLLSWYSATKGRFCLIRGTSMKWIIIQPKSIGISKKYKSTYNDV